MFALLPEIIMVVSTVVRTTVWVVTWIGHVADPMPSQPPERPDRPQWVQTQPSAPFERSQKSALEKATVIVGDSCSGVCVDPRGYVLTARHCQPAKQTTVTFPGSGQHPAVVMFSSVGGYDGAVLLKVEGGPFPYMPVSDSEPMPGAAISNAGYQAAQLDNFVSLNGTLLGESGNSFTLDSSRQPMYAFSTAAMGGMSGGPVVNDNGEVFSLNVSTDTQRGFGMSLTALRQAAKMIPPQTQADLQPTLAVKRHLEIWTISNCPPCRTLKGDMADASFRALIEQSYIVEFYSGDDPANAASMQARGITQFPSFVIRESKEVWSGYAGGKATLLNQLGINQPAGFSAPDAPASPPLTLPESALPSQGNVQPSDAPPSPAASSSAAQAAEQPDSKLIQLIGWLLGLVGLGGWVQSYREAMRHKRQLDKVLRFVKRKDAKQGTNSVDSPAPHKPSVSDALDLLRG